MFAEHDLDNESLHHFESWSELVEYAEKRIGYGKCSRETYRPQWHGTENFEEAVKLAETGWEQGTEKCRALASQFINKVTTLVENWQIPYNVTGSDFDVSLVNQGIPEHWCTLESHLEDGAGTRAVRITLNTSIGGGASAAQYECRGAALVALVECLEFSGIRCEVNLYRYVVGWNSSLYEAKTFCNVKAAEQPLDMDRLAFMLAHPSTNRRLMFAVMEGHAICMNKTDGDYGSPSNPPLDDPMRGDIYIGNTCGNFSEWENSDMVIAWIIECLKTQGVKIEGLEEHD